MSINLNYVAWENLKESILKILNFCCIWDPWKKTFLILESSWKFVSEKGGHFILYKLDISRHRPICGLFSSVSLYSRLFNDSGSNYLRNIFTAFALGLSGQKLNSKNARKFFITAVDFWVFSTQDKSETKNTAEHDIIAAQYDLCRASTRAMLISRG